MYLVSIYATDHQEYYILEINFIANRNIIFSALPFNDFY